MPLASQRRPWVVVCTAVLRPKSRTEGEVRISQLAVVVSERGWAIQNELHSFHRWMDGEEGFYYLKGPRSYRFPVPRTV